jgi:hypothetical protein
MESNLFNTHPVVDLSSGLPNISWAFSFALEDIDGFPRLSRLMRGMVAALPQLKLVAPRRCSCALGRQEMPSQSHLHKYWGKFLFSSSLDFLDYRIGCGKIKLWKSK